MLTQSLLNDIKFFLLSRFPEDGSVSAVRESVPDEEKRVKPIIPKDETRFSTDLTASYKLRKEADAEKKDEPDFISPDAFEDLECIAENAEEKETVIFQSSNQKTEDIALRDIVKKVKGLRLKSQRMQELAEISNIFENLDESFSATLIRYIDKAGMTDADCYKKALLNKSHFNKIKNDPGYNVQKETVFALILALSLSKEDADILLLRAGYAFSSSSKFDSLIEYCINHEIYNLLDVNEILYAFDQKLLGAGFRR